MNLIFASNQRTVVRRASTTVLLAGLLLGGCDSADSNSTLPTETPADVKTTIDVNAQSPKLTDVAAASGLVFDHINGATDQNFMPEIIGSGGGFLDYDNDGDLDVILIQSGRINDTTPPKFDNTDGSPSTRLFRSNLVPTGSLSFTDVTEEAGLITDFYGMGVASGDLDNDGDLDLYITNLSTNALYLNNGDGTFSQAPSGIEANDIGWSTSASFFDFDRDGALDLFVTRYVQINLQSSRDCTSRTGMRDYCTPDVYLPITDKLFKGDGKGGLTELKDWRVNPISPKTGLGVVAADYNGDGYPDIYVANDKKANQLWLNQQNGTFEDNAVMNGSAYDINGKPEASMGVTSGDVDLDGDEDLFMTHVKGESNTLYLNQGNALFLDSTIVFQLSSSSLPSTGFGTRWVDIDNDGDLDLFAANGAVMIEASQVETEPYPYVQSNQLFINTGNLKFVDASESAGFKDEPAEISRGAAFGDVDNDGDVDILVTNNNGPVRLLLNQLATDTNWLSVAVTSEKTNHFAFGARIGLVRDGQPVVWRRVGTDGSYLSANDVRVHFGLGDQQDIDHLLVQWPDGTKEKFADISANQFIQLQQGNGVPQQ